jgi:hypothetical protein
MLFIQTKVKKLPIIAGGITNFPGEREKYPIQLDRDD